LSIPKFSVVTVGRNEAKTLPRLLGSLKEFLARGGDFVLVDNGSTDDTVKVARDGGANVIEVGDRFRYVCPEETAQAINEKFVVQPDGQIIKAGDSFFAFDQARNFAMDYAKNDFLCTPDCDEAWTNLDVDRLNELIEAGWQKFIVEFVFAHNPDGTPAVSFCADTRFYDRRVTKWKGIIHETMRHPENVRTLKIPKEVAFLEHFQNKETDRSRYLAGLAWACHVEPENDRNSHYFARELMYRKMYHSAIKEFHRHIDMNGWADERGQSMIYLGQCYEAIGDMAKALEWWQRSESLGVGRRAPFINMAYYWKKQNKPALVAAYAAAAMEIKDNGFYANRRSDYTYEPHALMYWAAGWQGDIPRARKHLEKCLEYHPTNETFLDHMKYYFKPEEQRAAMEKAGVDSDKWKKGREINRIAMPITRSCNRKCPECPARVDGESHVSVDELKRVGKLIGPIKTIEVTGGEPAVHPDFEEISKHIHDWFDCKDILLLTNGEAFRDESKLPLLLYWDRIYVSWYTNDFALKYRVSANTDVVNKVEDYCKKHGKKCWVQRMDAHDNLVDSVPGANGCKYGYDRNDMVAYYDGKIYGCCTSWMLKNRGVGIQLEDGWRGKLSDMVPPCDKCFLGAVK